MATSSREARRRRILERGSDRLALITGQIPNLPSSSQPSISLDPAGQLPAMSSKSEEKAASSLVPQHESDTAFGQLHSNYRESREPFMRKYEMSTEAFRAAMEFDRKGQASPSTVQNSSISTANPEPHIEQSIHHHKFFTPNQISSAISDSEISRFYCSLAAAILVALSCIGFPILGSNIIKSIILFRPLHLLLLTNVSIVLARLLLVQQRGLERPKQQANSVPSIGEFGLADQVGKALESGLVMQNILKALFMDCSVYVVMVICGISLAKILGW